MNLDVFVDNVPKISIPESLITINTEVNVVLWSSNEENKVWRDTWGLLSF